MRRVRLLVSLFSLATLCLAAARPSYTATEFVPTYSVTELPVPAGYVSARPVGVNDSGTVLLNAYTAGGETAPFVWQAGTLTALGTLGGTSAYARAIGTTGQVVGESRTKPGFVHAFSWQNGVMTDIDAGSGNASSATSVNSRGQVTVIVNLPGNKTRSYVWKNGRATPIRPLGGAGSQTCEVFGINDRGDLVGFSDWIPKPKPFHSPGPREFRLVLWTGGDPILIGPAQTRAIRKAGGFCGLNNGPEVYATFPQTPITEGGKANFAIFWAKGRTSGLVWLDRTPDPLTAALAINDQGQVVGTTDSSFDQRRAFLWQHKHMDDLNGMIPLDSQWVLNEAGGTNTGGWIVGSGLHEGLARPFLLTPLPIPID